MATDPNALKYTYEHYVHFPTDGKRHEIVDGEHFVNPAPSTRHQYALHELHAQLREQIQKPKLGIIFAAPVDVQLSDFTVLQPDLVVVLNDRRKIVTDPKIDGAPSLVVEVISPSSPNFDRTTKKQAYQLAGIPEYWIVDPIERTVEQFALKDGRYETLPHNKETVALTILNDVKVVVNELWFNG